MARVENTFEKEKMLVTIIFSFSQYQKSTVSFSRLNIKSRDCVLHVTT